jgi:hypothetical protein
MYQDSAAGLRNSDRKDSRTWRRHDRCQAMPVAALGGCAAAGTPELLIAASCGDTVALRSDGDPGGCPRPPGSAGFPVLLALTADYQSDITFYRGPHG